jgi:hypothetical protein
MKRAPRPAAHFVVCLNNDGYQTSLELGKLYRFIPDEEASAHGLVRVVNESGEDSAVAADRFRAIDLPPTV